MAADQGTGTTIAFGTSSFHSGVTFIDVSGSMSRGAVETTHLGTTGYRTFEPEDLPDPGTISVTFDFDPGELDVTGLIITKAAETVTITFPNGTYAGSMFATNVSFSPAAVNTRMTCSMDLKVSGAVTVS